VLTGYVTRCSDRANSEIHIAIPSRIPSVRRLWGASIFWPIIDRSWVIQTRIGQLGVERPQFRQVKRTVIAVINPAKKSTSRPAPDALFQDSHWIAAAARNFILKYT
jgi:hypothetical protein